MLQAPHAKTPASKCSTQTNRQKLIPIDSGRLMASWLLNAANGMPQKMPAYSIATTDAAPEYAKIVLSFISLIQVYAPLYPSKSYHSTKCFV